MVQTADFYEQLAAVRAAHPIEVCEIEGHAWTYINAGGGDDTILLLPGALGEADTSFQYILALHNVYRVVSIGYPATLDRLGSLIDGLDALLGSLHVSAAHVVGGSYSGLTAQYYAARHPQRVRSLLLSNTGAPDPTQTLFWRLAAAAVHRLPEAASRRAMRASIRRFLPSDSPAAVFWRDYFAASLPRWSKAAVVARLRLLRQMHGRAEAATLRRGAFGGPALIVDAAGDRLVPQAQREGLRRSYPQAQHVMIENKGHVASLDETAAYIHIYREFLCRLDAHAFQQDAA